MNSFTILGTSSGVPHPERCSSGYVLQTGESLSLIDCGGGVSSAFVRYEFDPTRVERIFITHSHPDHVTDLPLFIQMIYLTRRSEPLDVYVPEEYVIPLQLTLRSMYVLPERFSFPMHVHGYKAGEVFRGPFVLTAIANSHLQKYGEYVERLELPNRMQCFSYKIELEGRTLLYTGDVGSLDDIADHIEKCDCLVTELSHIDAEAFLESDIKDRVRLIVVTHLGDDDENQRLRELIEKTGRPSIIMAEDGMELELEQV